MVEPNDTLMTSAIHHYIRQDGFRLKRNHRLYLAKVIHGLVDHEPVKIYIFVIDVFTKTFNGGLDTILKMSTQTLDHLKDIEASYEGQPGPLPPVEVFTSLTIQTAYGTKDKYSIYHWDGRVDKSRCFDFGDFLTAKDIEDNLGIDVGIIPYFWGDIRMRDHDDNNIIWAETIRITRKLVFDEA